MTVTDVLLERETANDETAIVVSVFVASGARVEKDEPLFDIENSKATQEVVAPEAGILTHELAVGHVVAFGVPIARITPDAVLAAPAPRAAVAPPAPVAAPPSVPVAVIPAPPKDVIPAPPEGGARHVSRAAAALMAELGLTSAAFAADFITARDVRAAAGLAPARPAGPAPVGAEQVGAEQVGAEQVGAEQVGAKQVGAKQAKPGQAVSARKRAEIDVLSAGAGATMLSVLGTRLGAMAVPRAADDFLGGAITDLVIYEAARLMRKYPSLNACYSDGYVIRHDAVHAGIAIDSGGQLVVYGIEDADRLGLPDVARAIAEAVGRYVAGALTAAEMTRATFTVTDLSAEPLDFVLPLLPRGQSCIIGITRDADGYRIFAGFDHRVTEGREVASFLGELRQRLLSFAPPRAPALAMDGAAAIAIHAAAECAYCARSAAEAAARSRDKGLLKLVGRDGREILCCASCWNGW
jgi:pyruvate/2-oxoglutarate dehydrogenase complex dihydrolipoamide acyltransferase (E2) component